MEIAERFGHLLIVHLEKLAMHPALHEKLARGRLGLGDLVLMMRENQIDTASMDIDWGAEIFHGHHRALNMPAWPSFPEFGLPVDISIGLSPTLPQGEIAYVFFLILVGIHPSAGTSL
jgi:hypothetical protein